MSVPTTADISAVLNGPHKRRIQAGGWAAFWALFAVVAVFTTRGGFNMTVVLAAAVGLGVFTVRRVLAGLPAFPVSER